MRRLVFHCLLELCRCRAKGIVEHAVLLGAPVGVTPERWAMARSIVAGRLINGYSPQDWVRAPTTRSSVHVKGLPCKGCVALLFVEPVCCSMQAMRLTFTINCTAMFCGKSGGCGFASSILPQLYPTVYFVTLLRLCPCG